MSSEKQPKWLGPATIDASDFEVLVENTLRQTGLGLSDFTVTRREKFATASGREYEIDCAARFEALGAAFLVVIECKAHNYPISRDLVLTLEQKRNDLAAQKAMMFSTVSFQSGAVEFAKERGIALIKVSDGASAFITKSLTKQDVQREHGTWLCMNDDRYSEESWGDVAGHVPSLFREWQLNDPLAAEREGSGQPSLIERPDGSAWLSSSEFYKWQWFPSVSSAEQAQEDWERQAKNEYYDG